LIIEIQRRRRQDRRLAGGASSVYGVLEMVRTGIVAMRRGNKPSVTLPSSAAPVQAMADDDLSQSV